MARLNRIPPRRAGGVARVAATAAPAGFTLVELLVVILIVAMLAAILTPAVMRAQSAARNAAIKAEIDMLHMAIMNYRNEYGSFPPCVDTTVNYTAAGPASKHLARLFPRCANPTGNVPGTGLNEPQFRGAVPLAPENALVAWLSGFSTNPLLPITGGSRQKMFDFDPSRISGLAYHPTGKPGSPYIYINSANYLSVSGSIPTFSAAGATYYAHRIPLSASGDFTTLAQGAFNPDTFQILCAGRDETFGNDDDLSNFWPGTRKEYLDSLKK